jgi:1-phosphofructokinase family hexose kinase
MDTASNHDTEFNQTGSRVSKKHLDALISELHELLNTHSWLALCGSVPAGIPGNFYATLIEKCKQSGILTCLDTSGEALMKGIRAVPDILRINLSELGDIFARKISGIHDTINALKDLRENGIGKTIVSMGTEGALGYDGENIWQVRVPHVEIRGLTGAGDAMTAGLIASFCHGKSFADSLSFSSALATASTLHMEPGDFGDENLSDILRKTTIEEITQ